MCETIKILHELRNLSLFHKQIQFILHKEFPLLQNVTYFAIFPFTFQTLEDASKFAQSFSVSSRNVNTKTDALLDTTNALRFELQNTGHDSLVSGAGNKSSKIYSVL